MAKKLKLEIDYFENYKLLSIATQLKDYTLAFHLNQQFEISLKKYDDLLVSDSKLAYPWFYFTEGNNYPGFYLIGNNHPNGKLIPSQKGIDFFLLIKELFDEDLLNFYVSSLRRVQGILGVFITNMSSVKNLDLMIESVEMHELEYVIKPARQRL